MSTSRYDNTFVLDFIDEDHISEWASSKSWSQPQAFVGINPEKFHTNKWSESEKEALLGMVEKITNKSRLYIVGHGAKDNAEFVYNVTTGFRVHYTEIAEILSDILSKPEFKINQGANNLTISLIACHGANSNDDINGSFAARLQECLKVSYNIWVNIVARTGLVVYLNAQKTSLGPSNAEEYHKFDRMYKEATSVREQSRLLAQGKAFLAKKHLGSKAVFIWQADGTRVQLDAYAHKEGVEFKQELKKAVVDAVKRSAELTNLLKYIEQTPAANIAMAPRADLLQLVLRPDLSRDIQDAEEAQSDIQIMLERFKTINSKLLPLTPLSDGADYFKQQGTPPVLVAPGFVHYKLG